MKRRFFSFISPRIIKNNLHHPVIKEGKWYNSFEVISVQLALFKVLFCNFPPSSFNYKSFINKNKRKN